MYVYCLMSFFLFSYYDHMYLSKGSLQTSPQVATHGQVQIDIDVDSCTKQNSIHYQVKN